MAIRVPKLLTDLTAARPQRAVALAAAAPTVSVSQYRVDVAPPSASLSLAADAPTVELVDASPLSLPAWVWNGTEYVRASFHLLA